MAPSADALSMLTLEFPEPDIAVLTLDDPAKAVNVLSRSVLRDLEGHLDRIAARDDLAGLIIRSGKRDNFIAGADLREFMADLDQPSQHVVEVSRWGQRLFGRLSQLPLVTIAAVHGGCLGGGTELAMWCDRRILSDSANTQIAFPEVKLGLFPGWGGTARTPRMVGLSNAVELVTGGDPIDAATARALGLADDVVPVGTDATQPPATGQGVAAPGVDPLLKAAMRMVRAEQKSQRFLADRKCWAAAINLSDNELAFLGATASAYIQSQTKGHYPAPLVALEVMLEAAGEDLETACELESKEFAKLFGSPVNRALLNVFFLQDENKKQASQMGKLSPTQVRSASVVGAGVMGQGIAAANAKRGVAVCLTDRDAQTVQRGVQATLAEASYDKQLKGPSADRALRLAPLVTGSLNDAEVAQADIVVEAIFENLQAKRALHARLEPLLSDDALLTTNTSTIPIATLAEGLQNPDRFCGLHFFNPVRRMPLVEVIRGPETSDLTVAKAVNYSRQIGKSPIVIQDGPGFLVNRVLMPYMNEALLLVEEGVPIKAVDRAATSFGMPMGPIALYDTVGLDVALHAGTVMHQAFPDRVKPSAILPAMVEAGRLGKKSGGGFFDYGGKRSDKPLPSEAVAQLIDPLIKPPANATATDPQQITLRLLLPMLLEATRILSVGVAASVRDVDLALILGIGFPPFRGGLFYWADTLGPEAILEALKPFVPLGARYEPTAWLKRLAEESATFYDGPLPEQHS
jgi:3-hydroxyacyl-CoA dehydrogenase/enoyl-CoA hydratase/3-hydroxybutyryl-CoA epimerase/3-hydroxyacyl-CoA dehydrogenase/enoyl-CoA hydratase/3-hydroxybutyryl-CoA epimerase/enoyl-CoA isomerase